MRWPVSCLPFLSDIAFATIRSVLERGDFDAIHCVGYYLAQTLPSNPGVPVVLAEDNIEYVCAWRRFLLAGTLIEKLAALVDFLKEKRLEIAVWESVAVCIVTSELDRALVASQVRTRVEVVPNGVDVNYFDDRRVPKGGKSYPIGMLANFCYHPNLDSFRYFRDCIMPDLRAYPRVPVVLIGNAGIELDAEVRGDSRFTRTGRVADVRPHLAGVDVVVCPLRLGGGTKLKVLESLSMRRAVVSSGIGSEGFNVNDGNELVIEDSPTSFAAAVDYLLTNPDLRKQLGFRGRSYVAANHDWDAASAVVASMYRSLTQESTEPDL